MPRRARVFVLLTAAALALGCSSKKSEEPRLDVGRGALPPRDAMSRMKLEPGFSIALVAAEPDVRQPVALNWDDRGRLWVVEYLQYPDPAGLRALSWDRYFRTRYDRVPEPPPQGPRGADRIKILEDRDGDGRAERVTVFADGLNLASGVAVGYGGVYVAQAPYLLFYPDRDGDDHPDGPPEVLLEGFGIEDAHAVVNSLTWGPDGWLYGAQGSTVTAHVRGLTFQQGIWRFHPRTREFELFAEGGGNTWSFDWDAEGNLLCGTNYSRYALLHMVQGGYYVKTFEKHGPLSNPYAFGYFPHAAHQGTFHGGHVTIGGLTYQADAFPERFRGKHIAANILSSAIYWFDVERDGSTFATRHGGEILTSTDPWFRPVDMSTGPDGSVYVVDWYDIRATHNNTRADTWDKTSGRIYRIDYGVRRRPPELRLARESSRELVERLRDPNEWYHREARRILAERRDTSLAPLLRDRILSAATDHDALESLWALYVSGGLDDATAAAALEHPRAPVRRWTARFLGDARRVAPPLVAALARAAREDSDVTVHSQLASTARRLPPEQALPILAALALRDSDGSDPHVPLLVWWGIEQHAREAADALVSLLDTPASWQSKLFREHLSGRLARRFASSGGADDLARAARLLGSAPDAAAAELVASGIDLGLTGRSFAAAPAPLDAVIARLWRRGAPSPALVRLAARTGNADARRLVARRAVDRGAPPPDRVAAIELLGEIGGRGHLEHLVRLASRAEPERVELAAITALGRFEDTDAASAVVRRLPEMSPKGRERALDLLVSRPSWARTMMAALGAEFRSQPLARVQKIVGLGDAELTAAVEKAWGRVAPQRSSALAEKARQLAGLIGPPELFGRPGRAFDRNRGKEHFRTRCARCHTLFAEGGTIGPDLTGADRASIDNLTAAIVDPSASIRGEFASFQVETRDGRQLHGVVLDPTPESFVLFDAQGEKIRLARADVREIKESQLSLMPEGLLDDLDPQGLIDFFSYLTAKEPDIRANGQRN